MVLGFMMMSAWVTKENRSSRLAFAGPSQANRVGAGTIDMQERYDQLSQEVAKLRAENTRLQKALGDNSSSTKVLNDSLQDAKALAALTELEGPGVLITLRDSSKPVQGFGADAAIHDYDVLRVVNELWNAGAEAIAVNGHRVSAGTSFRCVGSTILVNDVRIASPVQIRAIGDSQTITGAMNLPGGVLDELRQADPAMVAIEAVKKMRLSAYTGSTQRKFGTVPKDSK